MSRAGSRSLKWADWVQLIDANYVGTWELPAIGAVTAPTAVLIRPDGYVAWVGDEPIWGSLTRSPAGSDRLLRRSHRLAEPLDGRDGPVRSGPALARPGPVSRKLYMRPVGGGRPRGHRTLALACDTIHCQTRKGATIPVELEPRWAAITQATPGGRAA